MPTFDSPRPVHAVIDLPVATVRINAADRGDTTVEVRPADPADDTDVGAADHTVVEFADGRLLVRTGDDTPPPAPGLTFHRLVESPMSWARSLLFGTGGSVQVTIGLPAGSRVTVKSAAALHCRGPLAEVSYSTSYGGIEVEEADRLRLKTTYGDISVGRAAGNADVASTHGDIHIGEIDGAAVVKNSHGDIRLGNVLGELRLTTSHGDAEIDRARATIGAKTAYGSLRIGEMTAGLLRMDTTGGGLELGIREGTAAWLDVSSKHSTVSVSLESGEGPDDGGDVVKVRAHTTYGDIDIHRS